MLLSRPRSEWPFYVAAVATAEACVDLSAGYGAGLAAGWALANTAEPLCAALLLHRWRCAPPDFGVRTQLVRFVVAGIVAGPMLGALIGTVAGVLVAGDPVMPRLSRWYVGDAMGVLVIAPALLVLWPRARPRPARRSLLLLLLVAVAAMGPWRFAAAAGLPFLTLPLMIFHALRHGLRGAAAAVLGVAVVVQAVTASGHGPFADDAGAFHGLVVAQMFLAMCAVTTYTVAVLAGELTTGARLEQELRTQALRDSLTGLANRRLLFDRIEQASRRLARRPGAVALLFIDLDAFKAVNDTYGHAVGDHILVQSADRLCDAVRDQDSISRIGGDEFLILAEGLRDARAARESRGARGACLRRAVSLGLGADPCHGERRDRDGDGAIGDPEAWLSGADRAMYSAKRAGGDRIAVA